MALHRRRLGTYLNDHLAAATGGHELAKRAAAANTGSEYGIFLEGLAGEVAEDRETLRAVIRALGIREDPLKKAGGWAGEKLGRLKTNGQLTGYSPLSRLVELEGLAVVAAFNRSLWTNLEAVRAGDARLAPFDVAELRARAERQLAGLEEHRVRAAIPALTDAV